MRYLRNDSIDPQRNMAFDETALTALTSPEPLFYLWQNAPAVIIGRNQSAYAEVNLPYLRERGIVLARRVTGGGAVYHDLGNLNYSFVGGIREMEALQPVQLIASFLRSLGVPAEVSGRNDILVQGRKCSGYAKRLAGTRMMIHGTLMWDVDLAALTAALSVPGSKLASSVPGSEVASSVPGSEVVSAGIASVRSRVCNLSEYLPGWTLEDFRKRLHDYLAAPILPSVAASNLRGKGTQKPGLVESVTDSSFGPVRTAWLLGTSPAPASGYAQLGTTDRTLQTTGSPPSPAAPASGYENGGETLPEEFLASVEELAESKFSSWDWIYGRSPVTDFTASRKFPSCGTVCAHYSVRHGLLADLSFTGDFLGALSLDTPIPAALCPAPLSNQPSPSGSPSAITNQPSPSGTPSTFAGLTLTEALNGTRFTPEALSATLATLPVASYFDGLSPSDLLSLLLGGR